LGFISKYYEEHECFGLSESGCVKNNGYIFLTLLDVKSGNTRQ